MTEEVKDNKAQEDWMTKKWRPMMAVMYMSVCIFDFIVFPIMFTIVQFWEVQAANDAFRQWNPITLGGGGLFHVAMGAVLGVSAWSRGQEKIAGVSTAPTTAPTLPTPSLPAPQTVVTPPINTTPIMAKAEIEAPIVSGFGGKAAPPPAPQPLI